MTALDRLPPLRCPPPLRPGDTVAVVAPSGPVDPAKLHRGVAWLRTEVGLDVRLGRHVLDRGGHGLPFLAGRDDDRAADLQEAWLDPAVAGVLCARGGDGAPRLVDRLDWHALARVPAKLLCGLSDITVLHLAFAARLGVSTLYGPMVATTVVAGAPAGGLVSAPVPAPVPGPDGGGAGPDAASRGALAAALLGRDPAPVVAGPGLRTLVGGRARGVTTGGCLALVAACVGTPDLPPARGGIVLLEDLGEAPYRVERMLTQLLRTGWFDGVAGVACGDFVACGEPGELAAVLRDRLAPLGVPVVTGLPFGHGATQLTVPLGRVATLDADAGTLAFEPVDQPG